MCTAFTNTKCTFDFSQSVQDGIIYLRISIPSTVSVVEPRFPGEELS